MCTYIIDVDGTICTSPKTIDGKFDYENSIPIMSMIVRLNDLYRNGHKIILFTARNMKTHKGNLELIERFTRPILENWLRDNRVSYHELIMGKPQGEDVVYVDDKMLTINQFLYTTGDKEETLEIFEKNRNLI